MLTFEQLEDRCLPSASLVNGILTVTGSNSPNKIEIAQQTDFALTVSIDGQTFTFDNSKVNLLVVNGLGGNDKIVNRTEHTAVMRGGDGDDNLQGGTGNNTLYGNAGNDFLHGTDVRDLPFVFVDNIYFGGADNDVIVAKQSNKNELYGGGGDDLLVDTVQAFNTIDGGQGNDRLVYLRAFAVPVYDPADKEVASIGQFPGIAVQGKTLYLTGSDGVDAFNVTANGSEITATATVAGVHFSESFHRSDVNLISAVGFGGNDSFSNSTGIDAFFSSGTEMRLLFSGYGKVKV